MTQTNESSFAFDLDKTVYFKPDYEILEMRKISLDPDILITPQKNNVQINGLILLQGEYEKTPNINGENDEREETDRSYDQVTKLTELSSGLVKFSHHFPIDITVPAYRVTNLSNISVIIQSFDYELPSPNSLKVLSKMKINGISMNSKDRSEQNEQEKTSESVNEQRNDANEFNEEKEPFSQLEHEEIKSDKSNLNQVDGNKEQEKAEDRKSDKKNEQKAVDSVYLNNDTEKNSKNIRDKSEERHHENKIQSIQRENKLTEANERDDGKQSDDHENIVDEIEMDAESKILSSENEQLDNETLEHSVIDSTREVNGKTERNESEVTKSDLTEEEQAIDIQVSESEEVDDEVKDVHFLTKIFNRASESPYSQLRIYIVQDGDTVHSIAKRYEVSSLKLLQLNNLSGEELILGELLYIPETVETKS